MADGIAYIAKLLLQSSKAGGRIVIDTKTDAANPIIKAFDPSGVSRAEMGSLAANGVSIAQWGFRANDASGNPVFDSLGLIKVMTSLGSYTNPAGGSGTGTGSMQTLAATTLNFSVVRAVNVFVIAIISAVGVSGNSALVQLGVDGTFDTTKSMIGVTGDTKFQSATLFGVWNVAAGSHSASLGIETVAGNSWSWDYTMIQAFQMGG